MDSKPAPTLSVDEIDLALRLYRRLIFRVLAIAVLGLLASVALGFVSPMLSPPYGVFIGGQRLPDWGLVITLVLLVAEAYWDGGKIGAVLNDPLMKMLPLLGMLTLPTVIAQKAHAIGMRWTGFMGPLKPAARK